MDSDGEGDFEVVPQEPEDSTMWDAEDENEDETKQSIIRGKSNSLLLLVFRLNFCQTVDFLLLKL